VFSNNAAVTLEQLSHLVDGQLDGITIKGSINFGQTVVCICKQCVCLYKHHLRCKILVGNTQTRELHPLDAGCFK